MKAIGGYFELEKEGIGVFPHKNGILLNTGRNALEYILRSIPSIKGIYLPYYTCEVVLEPIKKLNIPFTYYHTNDCFEIAEDINLEEDQYIIVNNYFGIKDSYIDTLLSKFGDHLIVDCAQALFAPILPEVKMFYSIRKFIGVPDGGVAYGISNEQEKWLDIDESYDRLEHLKIRKKQGAETGFGKYQENETKLNNQPILQMSAYTRFASRNIDYNSIITKRRTNYQYLNNALKTKNHLSLPDINSFACPMVYPFIGYIDRDLRKELISKKIFVARYWPNVVPYRDYNREVEMTDQIMPLPIDQRYGKNDMDIIIKTIIQ
ncbi:hypothetical protein [Phocaeicola oris]|uniref:hypothetical protein n=1 Tax=Phocaeicola oris TaxID=2896850 RepID=UPI00234EB95F|nr:hypothetical protein [Phocaeicola oris]MCE2615601.1 hypothetical protein [Phocaeicola oris]